MDTLDRQGKILSEIEKFFGRAGSRSTRRCSLRPPAPMAKVHNKAPKRRDRSSPSVAKAPASDTADAPARQSTKGVRKRQAEGLTWPIFGTC